MAYFLTEKPLLDQLAGLGWEIIDFNASSTRALHKIS